MERDMKYQKETEEKQKIYEAYKLIENNRKVPFAELTAKQKAEEFKLFL